MAGMGCGIVRYRPVSSGNCGIVRDGGHFLVILAVFPTRQRNLNVRSRIPHHL